MSYVISQIWPWLVLALVAGLVVVAVFARQSRERVIGRWWLGFGIALFVVVLIAVLAKTLPGREGLYLEIALLVAAAYAIGRGVVALFGRWPMPQWGVVGRRRCDRGDPRDHQLLRPAAYRRGFAHAYRRNRD